MRILVGIGLALAALVLAFLLFFPGSSEEIAPENAALSARPADAALPVDEVETSPHRDSEEPSDGRESGPSPAKPQNDSASAFRFPEERIMETLDGVVDVNALLDAAIHYASLPLDPKVDFDYELSDGTTFRFKTDEPGVRAYFDIQGEPDYQQDGSWIRRYSVKVHREPPSAPWIVGGVVREGPRFGVSIARDSNGRALYLMAMTHVRVALGDSRELGINAYQGTYDQGLYYSCYFDPSKPVSCKKMQVVDGQQRMSELYPLIEASGTLFPDQEKLDLLKEKIEKLIKEVSK